MKFATFFLMLFFINLLFGYQTLLDLNSYSLTHEKLLTIAATSTAILLCTLAFITYQLFKHGYTLEDIKRIHVILQEEEIKRQKDSLARLKWGFVDWVLWAILVANAAILFSAHYIIIGLQILDLAAIFAMIMSGVMFYTPPIFLVLYPIGRMLDKNFPFDSPIFFFSFGFVCLALSLMALERLEGVWWDPIAVSLSWIAVGVVSLKRRKFVALAFAVWFIPMIVAVLKYGWVVVVPRFMLSSP